MIALEDIVQAAMTAPSDRREAALRLLRGEPSRTEPYLTLAELSEHLGYSTRTLLRWQVPSHQHGGKPRYRLAEVEGYFGTEKFQRRQAALRAERRQSRKRS